MPVTLDAFRAIAQDSVKGNGFIRLSRSTNNRIVRYGNSFAGRVFGWYSHPEHEENRTIREQFYNALRTSGLQENSLAQIRAELHLDDAALAETQLCMSDVKRILKMAENCPDGYANKLKHEGYSDPDIQIFIRNRLGADAPGQASRIVTEEEKTRFKPLLKKECRRLFAIKKDELELPDANKLYRLTGSKSFMETTMKTLEEMLVRGVYNGVKLAMVKNSINSQIVQSQRQIWQQAIHEKVKALSSVYGDCSAMEESFLEKVMSKMKDYVCDKETVIQDPAPLADEMERVCQKFLRDATAMLQAVNNAEPPFGAAEKEAMRKMVLTDSSFRNLNVVGIFARFKETMLPFLEITAVDNPSMQAFIDEYSKVQKNLDQLSAAMRNAVPGYGGDDVYTLYEQMFELSKAVYQDKHGGDMPAVTQGAKKILSQYWGEMEYISNHLDDANNPSNPLVFKHSEADLTVASLKTVIEYYAELLNVQLDVPEDINGVSQPVVDFLRNYKIYERNPFNHPLNYSLDPIFQNGVIQMSHALDVPENVNDMKMDDLLGQTILDLNRVGTSWKVDGEYIERRNDHNGTDIGGRLNAYFSQDKAHGKAAAFVMNKLLNQRFIGICESVRTMEPTNPNNPNNSPVFRHNLIDPYASINDFEVKRGQDGSYELKIISETPVQYHVSVNKKGHQTIMPLDLSKTEQRYEMTLKLSFGEDGKPALAFVGPAKLTGGLYLSPLNCDEVNFLKGIKDPTTGEQLGLYVMHDTELQHDAQLKELLDAGNSNEVAAYLRGKTVTDQDEKLLVKIGVQDTLARNLCQGLLPGTRVTKDLMNRLRADDPATQTAAVDELRRLCQPYIDRGFLDEEDVALAPERLRNEA